MNMMPRTAQLGREPLDDNQLQRLAPSIFADHAHESRSERFTYIPTYRLLGAMRNEGFEVYGVRQGGSRIPGKEAFTKHMLRFRHRSQTENRQMTVGDTVHEIVLLNAHDGTASYQMQSGTFRLICLNGMIVSDGFSTGVKVPHRGDVLDQVIEGAYTVLGEHERVEDAVARWSSLDLSPREQEILAEGVHEVRFEGNEHTPEPAQLLNRRRYDDRGNDLWRVTNVVQENAMRGGLRFTRPPAEGQRRPRRARTRAVGSVDGDTKINKAIWSLAEKMAELKAA